MTSKVNIEKVRLAYVVRVHSKKCFLDCESLCILYQQNATSKQEYEKDSAS